MIVEWNIGHIIDFIPFFHLLASHIFRAPSSSPSSSAALSARSVRAFLLLGVAGDNSNCSLVSLHFWIGAAVSFRRGGFFALRV